MWALEVVCSTAVLEQPIEDAVADDGDDGASSDPASSGALLEETSTNDRSNRSDNLTNENG